VGLYARNTALNDELRVSVSTQSDKHESKGAGWNAQVEWLHIGRFIEYSGTWPTDEDRTERRPEHL